jgi:hypothetical protein
MALQDSYAIVKQIIVVERIVRAAVVLDASTVVLVL